jgi:hypothetical protein
MSASDQNTSGAAPLGCTCTIGLESLHVEAIHEEKKKKKRKNKNKGEDCNSLSWSPHDRLKRNNQTRKS